MDSKSIELPGSTIAGVEIAGERITVRFEPAYLIESLTGSEERIRYWQNANLVFEGAELEDAELPEFPATCSGGDVGENVYTYRDMIPIPLESRGRAHCDLKLGDSGQRLRVQAEAVTLVMEDRRHYVEHIRPGS